MPNFCTQCGSTITDSVKFCGQCGVAVTVVDAAHSMQPDSPKDKVPAIGGWLLVMCASLVLPVLVSSLYSLYSNNYQFGVSTITDLAGFVLLAMLIAKKTKAIYFAKLYFSICIFLYSISFIILITVIPLDDIQLWQLIIITGFLLDIVSPIVWLLYISKSKRVKLTFPEAFK